MQKYYSGLLRGYTYKGADAAVAVEIRSVADSYRCATIYQYVNDEPLPVAEYDFGSLHDAHQWLSRTLDGKPKIFGEYSLADTERRRASKGEGAEHFVIGTLMLDYGMSVSQADRGMPGYDLTVEHPNSKRFCRLQVKFVSTPRWPAVNCQNFDFLVVVTPVPLSAMALLLGEPAAKGERKFTAYVIPVGDVQAKRARPFMRSPLRHSAYEWAWEPVIDYMRRS